jgi:hypothetical protein
MVKEQRFSIDVTVENNNANSPIIVGHTSKIIMHLGNKRELVFPDSMDYLCKIINYMIESMSDTQYKEFMKHIVADKL